MDPDGSTQKTLTNLMTTVQLDREAQTKRSSSPVDMPKLVMTTVQLDQEAQTKGSSSPVDIPKLVNVASVVAHMLFS